ncbi:YncE family protein [Mucilaginibacter pallidiroseus]|uniref:YncE family protein n=1 Tax=Mucilaginibacter pallidiroseus TaxID=2599295 RepID=A0A563UIQ1_9SPHI|nr:DUF5074 domain-containing protein [Mucilaginibacter pallidiroseus]TWR31264.1 YncE family protein [Mucilaginibacter pallidiroseus]
MKHFNFKNLFTAITLVAALSACKKDRIVEPIDIPAERAGVYILNQGNINANNSTLTYFNYATQSSTSDIFSAVNGTKLGDTGNDIKIYGSKMYIVVNVSSTIEVVDPKTTKSIKRISMLNGTAARQPRYIVFNKNKAFISSYDGTVAVLDTASLAIEKYITVGRNPEQMVISNNKLYVANSGGLDFGNPDKTVSVINLSTLTETKKVEVVANPTSIGADSYGHVYVLSNGDYKSIAAGLTIINNATDAVTLTSADLAGGYGSSIVNNGDYIYYISASNGILVYNTKTQKVEKENFITDNTAITSPFNIAYDDINQQLFVMDAKNYATNGQLFAFGKDGKLVKGYPITTGITPGAVVFVNK